VLTHDEYLLLTKPPYSLTASLDTLLNPKPTNSRRKKNCYPPRPRNSWLIFRIDYKNKLRAADPDQPPTIENVSRRASKDWANQSDKVKQFFTVLSKIAKKLHEDSYPNYIYAPRRNNRNEKYVFRLISEEEITGCKRDEEERNRKGERDGENCVAYKEKMDERVYFNQYIDCQQHNIADAHGEYDAIVLDEYDNDINNTSVLIGSDITDSTCNLSDSLNTSTVSQSVDTACSPAISPASFSSPTRYDPNQLANQTYFAYCGDNEISPYIGSMSTQPLSQTCNYPFFEPLISNLTF
ncbi:6825_t:CDS:1, partial [Paraglomus occultum]